ncbi:MAG: hypothetical protein ABI601_12735, partial [bacterium]
MPMVTNERARARTPEVTERDAASERFAATLAGALAPHAHSHTQPKVRPAESSASSELDRDDAIRSSEARDESAASDRAAAARRESAAEPVKPKEASTVEPAALGAAASGLDARLQQTLARVVSRMKSEFGRDVSVVEGVRSQQRQEQLFAQGRTTSGSVVTWTHHSLHTAGRAADVTIDGGYEDAAGFALLRQVAEEEGLHTLGARDPGHLELRGARGAGIDGALAQTLAPVPSNGVRARGQ